MTNNRIISLKTLKEKKFYTMELGKFSELIGEPEAKCNIMVYGPSGSGKTVWVLQLAEYVSKHYGKVLYDCHEEGFNKTVQTRANQFNIESDKLYFGNGLSFEFLIKKIKANYYRAIVIDSVQYAKFTIEQLQKLRDEFAKRKLMIILVSFGTAVGSTKNANDLLHACDIKCFIKAGSMEVASRYLGEPKTVRLFNAKNSSQLPLEFANN